MNNPDMKPKFGLTPEDKAFEKSVLEGLQQRFGAQFRGGIANFSDFIASLTDIDQATKEKALRVYNIQSNIVNTEMKKILKPRS